MNDCAYDDCNSTGPKNTHNFNYTYMLSVCNFAGVHDKRTLPQSVYLQWLFEFLLYWKDVYSVVCTTLLILCIYLASWCEDSVTDSWCTIAYRTPGHYQSVNMYYNCITVVLCVHIGIASDFHRSSNFYVRVCVLENRMWKCWRYRCNINFRENFV